MGLGRIRRKVMVGKRDDGRTMLTIEASRTHRFRTILGPEFYPALLEMNRRLASPAQRTVVVRLATAPKQNQNP